MNSTEVQNPRRKLDVFGSKFLPVQSLLTVSEALLLPLRTLSLSFVTNNSSSDTKAFLRFIAFSGSQIAVHRDFLFFSDAKAWPQSQTDLFTCTTVLHCGHTFLRRIGYYTVGIPFWTSRKRQSRTFKLDGKTACSNSHDHTLPLCTCYREVYGNIAREENGWLSRSKFITLLTFELSSFRENGFLILLHFPRCSRWYLSLDA